MARLATIADLTAITTIDPTMSARRRDDVIAAIGRQLCWACDKDGALAAYAVVHDHFFGQPFLDLLMVKSDLRGSGLGAHMIEHIVQSLAEPKLFTSTNRSNAPMHGLLGKLGFERIGELTGLDEDDPEVFYLKRL